MEMAPIEAQQKSTQIIDKLSVGSGDLHQLVFIFEVIFRDFLIFNDSQVSTVIETSNFGVCRICCILYLSAPPAILVFTRLRLCPTRSYLIYPQLEIISRFHLIKPSGNIQPESGNSRAPAD